MTSYGTILSEPVDTRNITFVQPELVAKCFFRRRYGKHTFFFTSSKREASLSSFMRFLAPNLETLPSLCLAKKRKKIFEMDTGQ